MKFKLFDKVRTLTGKNNIPTGSIGHIVEISDDSVFYIVEFIDSNGNTIDWPTYKNDEIVKAN